MKHRFGVKLMPYLVEFVLANACISFVSQFCRSIFYPRFGIFTVVYARNVRLHKTASMAEVSLDQYIGFLKIL